MVQEKVGVMPKGPEIPKGPGKGKKQSNGNRKISCVMEGVQTNHFGGRALKDHKV